MAQLDTMLRALADRGAASLVLTDGCRPVFRYPEGDRPVSQVVLNRGQIVALLSELTGEQERSLLLSGKPVRFAYRLDDGSHFDCEAGGTDGDFQARVMARREPEPETAPADVASVPEQPAASAEAPVDRPTGVNQLLTRLVEADGSDLHLSAGEVPMMRIHGEMKRVEGTARCSDAENVRLLSAILPPPNRQEYEETNDTDFAHEIPGVARFRVNVFRDRKGTGAVFRVIPTKIPTPEDLGLPAVCLDFCKLVKGLVLVTGPTGSGKSTTLAAMIGHINESRTDHIITIEDPVEFVHENRRCLVNQREVGSHTHSFKRALRAALREDPDIVLVGEMRDLETIAIAIETAETGHLVLGTLHTTTAASTVDRVIDQFPADRQSQIRTMLSESLKGVISQTLLRKIGGGRVAALEVLVCVPAISNLIREGKTYQIPSIMQTGKKHGMRLLNDSLLDLARRKVVAPEEAYRKAADKPGFAAQLRAAGVSFTEEGS